MDRPETTDGVAFEPLLNLEIEMTTFTTDWSHCDRLSNYVARMVSHDRRDPIRHANLLSSAINELLEMSFRTGAHEGELECELYRCSQLERIKLTFPCPPSQRHDLNEAILSMKEGPNLLPYLEVIASDVAPLDQATLLGLVVNYDAAIRVGDSTAERLTLVVDLPLEGLLH